MRYLQDSMKVKKLALFVAGVVSVSLTLNSSVAFASNISCLTSGVYTANCTYETSPAEAPNGLFIATGDPLVGVNNVVFGLSDTGGSTEVVIPNDCYCVGTENEQCNIWLKDANSGADLVEGEVVSQLLCSELLAGGSGPECGDTIVDSPEQCDDGGIVNGDGCDSSCQIEEVPPVDSGTSTLSVENPYAGSLFLGFIFNGVAMVATYAIGIAAMFFVLWWVTKKIFVR